MFVSKNPTLFKKNDEISNRRLRENFANKIYTTKCRLKMTKNNVFHMACKLYNNLPNNMRNLPHKSFDKNINNWLLTHCFYSISEYIK